MSQPNSSNESPDSKPASCCTPGSKSSPALRIVLIIALGILAFVIYKQIASQNKKTNTASTTPTATAPAVDNFDTPGQSELQMLQERFRGAVEKRLDAEINKALTDCRALIKQYPRHAPLHTLEAQILLEKTDFNGAYAAMQQSLALDRQQPEVQLLAGTIALQLNKIEEAAQHYSQAVGLSPREPRYKIHLAQVYVTLKDLTRAKETYLQALRDDSFSHEAYKGLSDVYARENKLEIALTQIQKAINNTPISQRAVKVLYLRQQATLLRRSNRPQESLQILQSLSPKERMDPAVVQETAVTWAMLEQPQQAAQEFDTALEALPLDPALLSGAAQWWLKAGDKTKASERLESLRRVAPHSPNVMEIEEMIRKQK